MPYIQPYFQSPSYNVTKLRYRPLPNIIPHSDEETAEVLQENKVKWAWHLKFDSELQRA